MTHPMPTTALDQITELLAEHGSDGLVSAVTVLLNEVMKIDRAHALGAAPDPRSEQCTRHADGFKPRTVRPGSARWPSRCPRPVGSSPTPQPSRGRPQRTGPEAGRG